MPVKTKTALDQTRLNTVKQTPYLQLESEQEKDTNAEILKCKAVVIIDPLTGNALGASDFLSKTTSTFEQQPDAVLSQANPVSATLYEVLPATANVEIISIDAYVNWAITQPTPLEVVVTVDGKTLTYIKANPVSTQSNNPNMSAGSADNAQDLVANSAAGVAFLSAMKQCGGRSVRVQVRVTWAITQPTPLVCRVKWAKK